MTSDDSNTPLGAEVLILWRLAAVGGSDLQQNIRPGVKPAARERLIGLGLLESDGARPIRLTLTDGGWAWCSENLGEPIVTRSPAANEIFALFLGRLGMFLRHRDLSLGEFMIATIEPPEKPNQVQPNGDPAQIVFEACRRVAGGRTDRPVRLSQLRQEISGIDDAALDRTLLALEQQGQIALQRIDNPKDIQPADKQAVLRTPGGAERHLLYLRRT